MTPWDPGGLGTAQERAHVLGILERVEDEHERRLAALDCPGEDLGHAGIASGSHDQGDPLVAVEAGQGGQRAAFHLDDRDPQAGRVQDDLLEGAPALGHDQQPARLASGDERLLDRPAPGHDLVTGLDQAGFGRFQPRARRGLANG